MVKNKKINSVEKTHLHLPISLARYKRNKILLLRTMISMIECMKRIENIRNLKREKAKLIEELKKTLNFSHKETNSLDKDLPVVSKEKGLGIRRIKMVQRINIEREISFEDGQNKVLAEQNNTEEKLSGLDKELAHIKAELDKLNREYNL